MPFTGYVKGVNRTIGKYDFHSFFGAQWLKVFYHRPGDNKLIFENEQQLKNINDKQRYSILGELNENYRINDKYEFLLYYPDISKFNWWRQSKLPYDETEKEGMGHADGYENVSISMTDNYWGGLVKQGISLITEKEDCGYECSFIEGSVGDAQYYYSIGLRKPIATVPAENTWVTDVYLWIRILGVNPSILFSKNSLNQLNYLPLMSLFLLNS